MPLLRDGIPIVVAVRRRMGDNCGSPSAISCSPRSTPTQHAAEMAEAAAERDKFWQMHAMLYQSQQALEDPDLLLYAAQVGIPPEAAVALRTHAFAPQVRKHFLSGVRSGVNERPLSSSTVCGTTVSGTSPRCSPQCSAPL